MVADACRVQEQCSGSGGKTHALYAAANPGQNHGSRRHKECTINNNTNMKIVPHEVVESRIRAFSCVNIVMCPRPEQQLVSVDLVQDKPAAFPRNI